MNQNSNEQQRFILALTLSLGLLMVFQYVFLPTNQSKNKNKQKKKNKVQSGTSGAGQEVRNGTTPKTVRASETRSNPNSADRNKPVSSPDQTSQKNVESGTTDSAGSSGNKPSDKSNETITKPKHIPEKTVVLENERLKATFTSRGGTLKSLILKEFTRTAKEKEKVQLLENRFQDTPSFHIRRNDDNDDPLLLSRKNWSVVSRPSSSEPDQPLVFRRVLPNGVITEKSFKLANDRPYMISFDVSFSAKKPLKTEQLRIYGPSGIMLQSKQDQAYHQGVYARQSGDEWSFENGITPSYLKDNENRDYNVDGPCWTGLTSKYFASVLIPKTNRKKLLGYRFQRLTVPGADKGNEKNVKDLEQILHPEASVTSYFITDKLQLSPNENMTFSFDLFAGPKKEDTLNQYADLGLPNLVNYVMIIGFLSKFFIWILGVLNSWINNYGVSILLLTLIVKLCLHPITKKAQVSMHKMKDLQPKIEALKEKYEDDRQKLGEEQMKLFKEHGVNPLGGCLPMLFQIPVLIGLYYGIRVSFEVRQKAFMLWINDLSQPDHFMEIGLGEFMGVIDLQYLNLLIILMMATWLLQALTQPTPDSGQGGMQSAMKFMPMIFGVICYNFASGLVLYWMMSTLFSALEQIYIRNIVLPSS